MVDSLSPIPPAPSGDGQGFDDQAFAKRYEGAIQQAGAESKQAYQTAGEKLAYYRGEEEGLRPPPAPNIPPPPQSQSTPPQEIWGSAAMIFAMLGSAFTRQPMVNALNAGAGVMNAFHQGDMEKAKTDMANWSAQMDHAVKMHEYQTDLYRDALERAREGERGALEELRVHLGEVHDQVGLNAIDAGGIERFEKIQMMRDKATSQAIEAQQKALKSGVSVMLAKDYIQQNGDPRTYTPEQKQEYANIINMYSGKGTQNWTPKSYIEGFNRFYNQMQSHPDPITGLPMGIDGKPLPSRAEVYERMWRGMAGSPPPGAPDRLEVGPAASTAAVPSAGATPGTTPSAAGGAGAPQKNPDIAPPGVNQNLWDAATAYVMTGKIPGGGSLGGSRNRAYTDAVLETAKKVREARGISLDQQFQQGQTFAARGSALKGFLGKTSDQVGRFSTALDHLHVLNGIIENLDNTDMHIVNYFRNAYEASIGKTAPTDFEGVKHAVANELSTAIIGAKGALGDRESMEANLSRMYSKEQLGSLIDNYEKLMAAQLARFERQYQVTGGPSEMFVEQLSGRSRDLLKKYHDVETAPPKGIPIPKAFSNEPQGTKFMKGNQMYIIQGDKMVPIQTPVQ